MAAIDSILNETTTKLEKPINEISLDIKKDKFKRVILQMIIINIQLGDFEFENWTKAISVVNDLDEYIKIIDSKYREVIL